MTARPRFTVAERRARLARRHGLGGPTAAFDDAYAATEAMVALHGTDPASIYLAARARVRDFEVASLEALLYDERRLIKHLAMRRTVFVITQDLLGVVQAAVSDDLLVAQRKALAKDLAATGVAPDGAAWLAEAESVALAGLQALGAATGTAWSKAVPMLQTKLTFNPTKAYGGDVAVANRVFTILALDGKIRRGRPGGWTSSQHRWEPLVTAPTSLASPAGAGPSEGADPHDGADRWSPAAARAELVRRWLSSFGPAPLSDLAWWTGLGVTRLRPALEAIGTVEVDVEVDVDADSDGPGGAAVAGFALADDLELTAPGPPWVAVLPALDPTAMGWKQRGWYFDADHLPHLVDRSGNIGATLWADGRIVGGWSQRRSGEVVWRILADIGAEATLALEAELAELQRWLGTTVVAPRFPVPLDKELRA